LEALKLELIKSRIEPILLIGGAFESVCACYLVCTTIFCVLLLEIIFIFTSSSLGDTLSIQWHPTKWKKFAMEVVRG